MSRRAWGAIATAALIGALLGSGWAPRPGPAAAPAAPDIRSQEWFLEAMKIPDAHKVTQGENVTVAVVDSGVWAEHPDLKGQVLEGTTIRSGTASGTGREDDEGHGTGMASLIAGKGGDETHLLGVAPKAKILPVRIGAQPNGSFDANDVYVGIQWAIDNGAKVINLSLGGERSPDAPWKRELIENALKRDVVLVAAAGNREQGDVEVAEPAAIPGVVAVSGLARRNKFWDGSVSGPEVVVSAPAQGLPHGVPTKISASGYALADGTSGATALVSGAIALIRSKYPTLSAAAVVNRLIKTTVDLGSQGRDPQFGFGAVDATGAVTAQVACVNKYPLDLPTGVDPTIGAKACSEGGASPGDSDKAAGGGVTRTVALAIGGGVFAAFVLVIVIGFMIAARRRRTAMAVGSGYGYPMGYPPGYPPGLPGGLGGYGPGQPGAPYGYPAGYGVGGGAPGGYGQQPGYPPPAAYPGSVYGTPTGQQPGQPGQQPGGYPPAPGGYPPAPGGYPPAQGGYPTRGVASVPGHAPVSGPGAPGQPPPPPPPASPEPPGDPWGRPPTDPWAR